MSWLDEAPKPVWHIPRIPQQPEKMMIFGKLCRVLMTNRLFLFLVWVVHRLECVTLCHPTVWNSHHPFPPLESLMHRPTSGSRRGNTAQEVYYTRRLITAREQGDPKGEASMHLNNLLGWLLHLHIWALPCHWGTMIHFPTPDSALTSIKQGGYKACLTACSFLDS